MGLTNWSPHVVSFSPHRTKPEAVDVTFAGECLVQQRAIFAPFVLYLNIRVLILTHSFDNVALSAELSLFAVLQIK